MKVNNSLRALPKDLFLNEVINGSKLVVLIFFYHELNFTFRLGSDFLHPFQNLVVYRHRVETHNYTDDLWFDFTDLPEESQLP